MALDAKVKDDQEKGMENAHEIREKVVQFFNDQHEEKEVSTSPIIDHNLIFENNETTSMPQSSRSSIDDLDQATQFLDSQLSNLGKFSN